MKVTVDPKRCDGYGRCEVVAPLAFRAHEDGAVVEILMPDEIPESYEGHVIRAVERCPKIALSLDVDIFD